MSKEVSITYNDIVERCKMLSAFEGRTAKDGSGESIFKDVVLTDNEDSLIKAWISQGLKVVEASLGGSLDLEVEYKTDGTEATMEMFEDKKDAVVASGTGSVGKSVAETLSVYVMYLWLADKLVDRSNAYKTIFETMLEATRRIAWKKKRPTMNED